MTSESSTLRGKIVARLCSTMLGVSLTRSTVRQLVCGQVDNCDTLVAGPRVFAIVVARRQRKGACNEHFADTDEVRVGMRLEDGHGLSTAF